MSDQPLPATLAELIEALERQFSNDVRNYVDPVHYIGKNRLPRTDEMSLTARKIIRTCAESMAAKLIVVEHRDLGEVVSDLRASAHPAEPRAAARDQ